MLPTIQSPIHSNEWHRKCSLQPTSPQRARVHSSTQTQDQSSFLTVHPLFHCGCLLQPAEYRSFCGLLSSRTSCVPGVQQRHAQAPKAKMGRAITIGSIRECCLRRRYSVGYGGNKHTICHWSSRNGTCKYKPEEASQDQRPQYLMHRQSHEKLEKASLSTPSFSQHETTR